MKESLKEKKIIYFIAGGLIGILFFWVYYGFKVIPPTSDQWIYERSGDFVQHYIGWEFYRKTPWQFPFGLTEGIATNPVSVIYTDSIPLFAVLFKILSPILPATFQYMGIWGLFCFIMQGGLGALITRRFTDKISLCSICSTFFCLSNIVIHRMYGHTALAGQWIILLAILIWLYQDDMSVIKRSVLWCVTAVIAVMIHAYFVPMVFFIMGGALLYDLLKNKKLIRNVVIGGLSVILVLGMMYCLGAFYGNGGDFNADGLGVYSSNLNTFINPAGEINSCFLPTLPLANTAQMEGFAYLGFGVIIGLIISFVNIVIWVIKNGVKGLGEFFINYWQAILSIILVVGASLFLAFMPVLTLNDNVILTLNYPEKITQILSIFRAAGRFSWITFYGLIVAFIALNIKPLQNIKLSYITIGICMILQFTDAFEKIKAYHYNFSLDKSYISKLQNEKWDSIGKTFKHIVFLPVEDNYLEHAEMFYQFGEYALRYDMDLSCFVIARYDVNTLKDYSQKTITQLQQGNLDDDTLYVLTDNNFEINSPNLTENLLDEYKIYYSNKVNLK